MAPDIRRVGGRPERGRSATYKVADPKVEGGEAAVVVYIWDPDGTWNAHCTACDAYKCIHADRALRAAKEGK